MQYICSDTLSDRQVKMQAETVYACQAGQKRYVLQEEVQLRVGVGVPGDFKQGVEDVVQQLLEVLNDALLLVHVVQTWQLQQSKTVCLPLPWIPSPPLG